ncbi:hypothetical protein M3D48_08115 [Dermabacter vaginalis]|uniref:hypothetical protein n=1 Tax=Dermabacter vaginalis TaxID=1630135 RepID=UPI0021A7B210|nr:hypothetical protein [Dermabacter vaginalis]MCT2150581.1 hypothetical protein [Dermabacter vaginalis]
MTEFYEAALATINTTFVYGLISDLIKLALIKLISFVVGRLLTRHDRKPTGKHVANTETELEKHRSSLER